MAGANIDRGQNWLSQSVPSWMLDKISPNWSSCNSCIKIWPKRWQVPILRSVKFDSRQESQKTIVTIDFAPSICLDCKISSKLKHLVFLVYNFGLGTDRSQHWQVSILTGIKNYKKFLSPLNSGPSIYVEFQISSKLKLFQLLFKAMAWKMTGANIDSCEIWQASKITKTIVTIEFTTLDLCRVRNFIKIEAFVIFVQNYGLKDDRCQHWYV